MKITNLTFERIEDSATFTLNTDEGNLNIEIYGTPNSYVITVPRPVVKDTTLRSSNRFEIYTLDSEIFNAVLSSIITYNKNHQNSKGVK